MGFIGFIGFIELWGLGSRVWGLGQDLGELGHLQEGVGCVAWDVKRMWHCVELACRGGWT